MSVLALCLFSLSMQKNCIKFILQTILQKRKIVNKFIGAYIYKYIYINYKENVFFIFYEIVFHVNDQIIIIGWPPL